MSTVVCSCLLGDNAKVRLQLSKILHEEVAKLYEGDLPEEESPLFEIEMKGCRREFYRNDTGEQLAIGQPVILEADGGHDFGIVYSMGRIARKKINLKGQGEEFSKLQAILRSATDEEVQVFAEIRRQEPEIRDTCHQRIERHRLDMKLVDVELRLDRQKLSIFYTATHRVDFRSLVRDLAGEFKARIQMIQITTREEARRANMQGPCGCMLCCSTWLQKIHANPFAEKPLVSESMMADSHTFNTIGLCNRPKCCLGFSKKGQKGHACRNGSQPVVGAAVMTREGAAIVEGYDAQRKLVWIRYVEGDQKRRLTIDQFNSLDEKQS